MYPTRALRAALAAIVVAGGCTEKTPTDVPLADVTPVDLELEFPDVTREALVPTEFVELEPAPGPARAFFDDPDPPDQPDQPPVASSILSASTTVGFTSTYAYSSGRQRYTGNIGRVETEAVVTFAGTEIARRPAAREEYVPYLLDFGREKHLWAEAYIHTDVACGLEVDGQSKHYASWQWFLGTSAPKWGGANLTTQAFPPVQQPPCQDPEPNGYTGGSGSDGGGPVSCWYLVTWDELTGEVVDIDLLYCDDVVGG